MMAGPLAHLKAVLKAVSLVTMSAAQMAHSSVDLMVASSAQLLVVQMVVRLAD